MLLTNKCPLKLVQNSTFILELLDVNKNVENFTELKKKDVPACRAKCLVTCRTLLNDTKRPVGFCPLPQRWLVPSFKLTDQIVFDKMSGNGEVTFLTSPSVGST